MKNKPQETDFYKTFYEELKSLSMNRYRTG